MLQVSLVCFFFFPLYKKRFKEVEKQESELLSRWWEKNHTDKNYKQYCTGPSWSRLCEYTVRHVYQKKKDRVGWRLLNVHAQEFGHTYAFVCVFSEDIFRRQSFSNLSHVFKLRKVWDFLLRT